MRFAWDPPKAAKNEAKHSVSFNEAITVFGDPLAISFFDASHSSAEDRFITIGVSATGRLLVLAHTDDEIVRVISARRATLKERRFYERKS